MRILDSIVQSKDGINISKNISINSCPIIITERTSVLERILTRFRLHSEFLSGTSRIRDARNYFVAPRLNACVRAYAIKRVRMNHTGVIFLTSEET